MSVIFGFINKRNAPVESEIAHKMESSMIAQSFDGYGTHITGPAFLGHHKMVVHQRQDSEKQPLIIGSSVICSDSNLENTQELCNQLQLDASDFTEPELILKAFLTWGPKCVLHFKGDFAFAIWDSNASELFLAVDHIGIRTIYYYESNDKFVFSSQIKAIEAVKDSALKVNPDYFVKYYSGNYSDQTYDKEIRSIPAANYLRFRSNNRKEMVQYWKIRPLDIRLPSNDQWFDTVFQAIVRKIAVICETKYSVGVWLSGGLDSSFVTALTCIEMKKQGRRVHAFCSILNEEYALGNTDERQYMKSLQGAFDNLDIHFVSPAKHEGPYSNLDDAFQVFEGPPNLWHYVEKSLFERAQKLDVKLIITGFGGDSAVSSKGYGVIMHYLSEFRFPEVLRLIKQKYDKTNESSLTIAKVEFLNYIPIYKKVRANFKKHEELNHVPLDKGILKKIKINDEENLKTYYKGIVDGVNKGYIGSLYQQLRKHANYYGQEFYSPLLDRQVLELCITLPGKLMVLNGQKRTLIRNLMSKIVPKEIMERTDKDSFSPDAKNRILSFDKKSVANILNKYPNYGQVDYKAWSRLVSNIENGKLNNEGGLKDEINFIPIIVIAIEFSRWLTDRSRFF